MNRPRYDDEDEYEDLLSDSSLFDEEDDELDEFDIEDEEWEDEDEDEDEDDIEY